MAKATAGVAVMVAALTGGVAARTDAGLGPETVIIVHIINNAHPSQDVLSEAETLAARVYEEVGVRIIWSNGGARTAEVAGAFHVDVVLVPKDIAARMRESHEITEDVLGSASEPARRAYIFYNHIFDYAMLTGSNVTRLMGGVIAHEVGHLVLPAAGHSRSGIMRANWAGRILVVPKFTAAQGTQIRALLAASRAE